MADMTRAVAEGRWPGEGSFCGVVVPNLPICFLPIQDVIHPIRRRFPPIPARS